MKDITLLVMAAGMGSRYGGLKQLDSIGPNNETIIDYSVFDAIRAGFSKVVFIIRKEFEDEFKEKITNKYLGKIEVKFAFQDLNFLPEGFSCPEARVKPWGTGHAILTARDLINEPFVAINGDDFYGRQTFKVVADFYENESEIFSMVAFQLDKTLSDNGSVSRGLCTLKNGNLATVIETHDLKKTNNNIDSDRRIKLNGLEPVSMNVWGFSPKIFEYLDHMFTDFLKKDGNKLDSEYLIPTVINNLIFSETENVHVLKSGENWFGITYVEDRSFVVKAISNLVKTDQYPENLF